MKKVLIMGATPGEVSLVIKAKGMGIKTYVTDYDPHAYAKRFADVGVNIDASHVEELVDYVKKEKIDGVLAGVEKTLLPYYYEVCKQLDFPCFGTLEQFEIMISRDKFKSLCRKYDVPVVSENPQETIDDEVVIYYVIQDGEPFLVGMCDQYTNVNQGGARIPASYIFPSRYLGRFCKETDLKVRKMLKGMGIVNGIFSLQAFVEDGLFRVYEPGFRFDEAQEHMVIGPATGVDVEELLLNFALTGSMGESVKCKADPYLNGKWGCKLFPLVRTGKIAVLKGLEEIEKLKGVIYAISSYEEGDIVTNYGILAQIICRILIIADSRGELKTTVERIYDTLKVLDEDENSMLLNLFDTAIIIERY